MPRTVGAAGRLARRRDARLRPLLSTFIRTGTPLRRAAALAGVSFIQLQNAIQRLRARRLLPPRHNAGGALGRVHREVRAAVHVFPRLGTEGMRARLRQLRGLRVQQDVLRA
eukprot:gene1213-506_t